MSALIPANFGAISTKFSQQPVVDDLSSGIQSSFGIVGYKGKVWSIRYRGDETPLMREDGDGPRGSIEAIILKASQHISKIWYEAGYVEGSNAAPDCFSNNGIAPEPTSAKKQCDSCALCPHNAWGSRITPAGKSGKACADSKRLAVVPLIDIPNEMYGGPMLLRVPAASLQDLAMYGQKMQQMGYPYYSVGTRIGFDANESYPKFTFGAIRGLNDAEADLVLAERDGHTVNRILSENEYAPAPAETPADLASVFEQPPEVNTGTKSVGDQAREVAAKQAEEAKKAAAAKKAAETKAANAAKAKADAEAKAAEEAAKVVTPEVTETDDEREERELLEKMEAIKAKKAAAAKAAAAAAEMEAMASAADAAQASDDNDSPVSDFEAELDGMLNSLLPS